MCDYAVTASILSSPCECMYPLSACRCNRCEPLCGLTSRRLLHQRSTSGHGLAYNTVAIAHDEGSYSPAPAVDACRNTLRRKTTSALMRPRISTSSHSLVQQQPQGRHATSGASHQNRQQDQRSAPACTADAHQQPRCMLARSLMAVHRWSLHPLLSASCQHRSLIPLPHASSSSAAARRCHLQTAHTSGHGQQSHQPAQSSGSRCHAVTPAAGLQLLPPCYNPL